MGDGMSAKKRSSSMESRLNEAGISMRSLVDTAMAMYIHDPAIGKPSKVRKLVEKEFENAFGDINVCSLVMAGLSLEEMCGKGLIPGISPSKYADDPVDLLADEILGQSIAVYIAGSRALFEFERLDKLKPGILGNLPPIMDDIIAGLISGVMVKVCSR